MLRCGAVHCFVGIEATADGGVTWHRIANLLRPLNPRTPAFADHPTDEATNDLWFANDQDGVLFAKSHVVLVTHDGGKQWSSVRIPGVVIDALSIRRKFVLVSDKCRAGDSGYPYCGASELVDVPFGSRAVQGTRRLPSCLARDADNDVIATDGSLFASGCHALFWSENGGATWNHKRLPFACTPLLIAADRPSDIWAMCTRIIGAGAQEKWIYRSLNGGTTWKLAGRATLGRPFGMPIGKVPFQGYAFKLVATSPQHAVMLFLFSGGEFATFDGGRVWVTPSGPASMSGPSAGMACVGSQDCWAAAGPVIVRTTKGGRSWTTAKSLIGGP